MTNDLLKYANIYIKKHDEIMRKTEKMEYEAAIIYIRSMFANNLIRIIS